MHSAPLSSEHTSSHRISHTDHFAPDEFQFEVDAALSLLLALKALDFAVLDLRRATGRKMTINLLVSGNHPLKAPQVSERRHGRVERAHRVFQQERHRARAGVVVELVCAPTPHELDA